MTHDRRLHKGRGATLNPEGRFETRSGIAIDDGWLGEDDPPSVPQTRLIEETARSIITRNQSPDISFNQSINPYRGCEHGCIYCYARPAHAYVNLSPGLDFETRILYKPNAAVLLERELRRPGYRCETIALGTNTDPYQPAERKLQIMRGLLEVMQRFRQPLSIVTKGAALMERDMDILSEMGQAQLAMVAVSITSLRDDIKRTLEPRTASPAARLRLIRRLRDAGVPVMVMVAPVIPFITDPELEAILGEAKAAGALAAGYIMLRLPWEVKGLFEDWLQAHFPLKARHVMSLVRQYRGGDAEYAPDDFPAGAVEAEDINQAPPEAPSAMPDPHRENPYYVARWGERQRGSGVFAKLVEQRFRLASKRLGLNRWHALRLDVSGFRVPPAPGDQLGLAL